MIQHRWVQGFHLNARGLLFGGVILAWGDEDATMVAYNAKNEAFADFVTAGIDRVAFFAPAERGDRLRFEYEIGHVGKSSLAVFCKVHNQRDEKIFAAIFTMVCVNEKGRPQAIQPCLKEMPKLNEAKQALVEKIRQERKGD